MKPATRLDFLDHSKIMSLIGFRYKDSDVLSREVLIDRLKYIDISLTSNYWIRPSPFGATEDKLFQKTSSVNDTPHRIIYSSCV